MKILSTFYLLLLFLSCNEDNPVEELVISFGSCNHQWEEQPIWEKISSQNPDIWIWLGDIIYADTKSMNKMKADYDLQSQNAEYIDFIDDLDVLGIWDDHDYGANNSGKDYPQKDSSKTLLLDFLGVEKNHPVWQRPGAYQAYTRDLGRHTIKIILLDVRYFREQPGAESTILGEAQWSWFEKELQKSDADMHIIGGGSQFLPQDHRYEKWANYPKDRARLIKVLDKYDVSLPLLLSGDRHLGEMSLVSDKEGMPILEVTSSGLTHSYRGFTEETNRHRIGGEVVSTTNFGVINITSGKELNYDVGLYNNKGLLQYSVNSEELKKR